MSNIDKVEYLYYNTYVMYFSSIIMLASRMAAVAAPFHPTGTISFIRTEMN